MQAVIVYESLYGNTRRVAEEIAAGLRGAFEVQIVPAATAGPEILSGADLVVVGAPTHGHGLPKPESRRQHDVPAAVANAPGIRELLTRLPSGRGRMTAAFDTRLSGPRWLWGAASVQIGRALTGSGYTLALPPESFLVHGGHGPMHDGQLERARAWGAELARHALATVAAPRVPV